MQQVTRKVVVKSDSEKKLKKEVRRKKTVVEEKEKLKDPETVEFSNIKNPITNFECKSGVKVQHGRSIIEKKEKELSVKELRKTITDRKLSKQEYNKLKSVPKKTSTDYMSEITPAPSLQLGLKAHNNKLRG